VVSRRNVGLDSLCLSADVTGVGSEVSRISVMMGLSSLLVAILQVGVALEQAGGYCDQYRVIMTELSCCYDQRVLLNVVCAGMSLFGRSLVLCSCVRMCVCLCRMAILSGRMVP